MLGLGMLHFQTSPEENNSGLEGKGQPKGIHTHWGLGFARYIQISSEYFNAMRPPSENCQRFCAKQMNQNYAFWFTDGNLRRVGLLASCFRRKIGRTAFAVRPRNDNFEPPRKPRHNSKLIRLSSRCRVGSASSRHHPNQFLRRFCRQ